MHYEDAVEFALARVGEPELHTRWSRPAADDCPAQPLPTDPDWAGGSLHEEVIGTTGRRRHRNGVAGFRIDRRRARFVGISAVVGAPRLVAPTGPHRETRAGVGSAIPPAFRRRAGLVARRADGPPASAATARECSAAGPAVARAVGARTTATAARSIVNARCFSPMALPVRRGGSRQRRSEARSSAVSLATSLRGHMAPPPRHARDRRRAANYAVPERSW